MYTYIHYQWGKLVTKECVNLDFALEMAWLDLVSGNAMPETIAKDGHILRTNGGHLPLREGARPLDDFLYKWYWWHEWRKRKAE